MNNEIIGTEFKYTIDTAYGINKDGFIAIGTESIVYKALKTARTGGLQFSCVLKFKPKLIPINGVYVDRLKIFKDEELSIFEELQECRSVARIYDVIEDLGAFSLYCDRIDNKIIDNDNYFCVVEEFIDGWSLEEYCREEQWKLRKVVPLENGLNRVVDYHDFTPDEKKGINVSYYNNYDNIMKYQTEIFQFMINLCDILEFVTEKKNILHLDIKPENIMVTKYGKELVLIDFGRSKKFDNTNKYVVSNLKGADYNNNEILERMYQYGTLGYAAPECYTYAVNESKFPFDVNFEQGKMTIESDIFSFGATFWECLNIFELVTESKAFTDDSHDFYKNNMLNDKAYCNRDLSLTSVHYHKKLEEIIKKCTKKRKKNYLKPDNSAYYHSYKDLRKDIEEAKYSAPTIVRAENIKVRNSFNIFGGMVAVCVIFVIISFIYRIVGFRIAQDKWEQLIPNYNVTQFYKLETIANDLIKTAPNGSLSDTYRQIAQFTYENGGVDEQEAVLLIGLLRDISNTVDISDYVDEIMQYANRRKFREISTEIVKLDITNDCVGYELAKSIYNAEVGKTGIPEAFDILQKYKDNVRFKNAVVKLKNVLDSDENIKILVSEHKGENRIEIQDFFKSIGS